MALQSIIADMVGDLLVTIMRINWGDRSRHNPRSRYANHVGNSYYYVKGTKNNAHSHKLWPMGAKYGRLNVGYYCGVAGEYQTGYYFTSWPSVRIG